MFLEIDDGVYVNLDNVFHVTWQSYENRGLWVFHAGAGEPHPPGPPATRWLPIQSRPFPSREEGDIWLRKILENAGILLRDPDGKEADRRRPRPGL
ncbi:MAG: hypothetical protein RQ801_08180 [Spirochaetaceae bacterium]|jgi:hypothetical protein|nr:hypothetical protein [Spirochaetaceae bacterium]MDT8298260.1 hypothetical protein [Spirochaetaceae bacterium]